jgi:hypothetical protein
LIREAFEAATGEMQCSHLKFTYREAVQSWKHTIERNK